MRLAETVRQKLAENFPHSGRHDLAIACDKAGWALNLTLERRDELGCLIWELALRRTSTAPTGTSPCAAAIFAPCRASIMYLFWVPMPLKYQK